MSKKDFAQIKAPHHEPKKHSSPLLPVIIILLAVICFAAGYWLAGQQAVSTTPQSLISKSELTSLQAQLQARTEQVSEQQGVIDHLKQQVARWKGRAEQDAHSKVGELHFYNDLPNQSVTPAPVMEPAKAPVPQLKEKHLIIPATEPVINRPIQTETRAMNEPAASKAVGNAGYKIQVASLRNRQDADALQQKLSKSGFRAVVQSADLGEKGQWFRVYAGPYINKAEALQHLSELEIKLHVKGLLINGR
ncbi:MAG: SPOR domain-containing protein [Mariprofundus sp.]